MCGVVGIIGTPDAAREAFLALTTLQHRGQDGAGILTHDPIGFHSVKNHGLVESVFTRDNVSNLRGDVAIAHNRYSTAGSGDINEIQPMLINFPFGIGMVHNGNIVNCHALAEELKKKSKRHLLTQSDSEILLNLFAEELARSNPGHDELKFDSLCSAVSNITKKVNGSYSVVAMIADHGIVAFRDPYGIRPLVWGKKKSDTLPAGEAHMFASESVALDFCGYEPVRNLEPGELVYIDPQGNVHTRVLDSRAKRHCMFEWIYFASPESVIDETAVYGTRIQLGNNLAAQVEERLQSKGLKADLVVPVPETARIAAIALAEQLKVPYREVLIKNRYIKRTFILDSQDKRQKAVSLKLSPVKSEIEGKTVLLVDDSIVRGTTSRKIIELVRRAGAAHVIFVSTCPPIRQPCFYGIDFPNENELIGFNRDLAEIEKELGADAVVYQDLEGLKKAIMAANRKGEGFTPCMACLDGKYPSDISAGRRFAAARDEQRNAKKAINSLISALF